MTDIVNDLYPTPRRKRFVQAVWLRIVYSQPEGDTRQSYYTNGEKVTDLANTCERAGWIERGEPLRDQPTRFWWQLTDKGREVLGIKGSSEEKSNG